MYTAKSAMLSHLPVILPLNEHQLWETWSNLFVHLNDDNEQYLFPETQMLILKGYLLLR